MQIWVCNQESQEYAVVQREVTFCDSSFLANSIKIWNSIHSKQTVSDSLKLTTDLERFEILKKSRIDKPTHDMCPHIC